LPLTLTPKNIVNLTAFLFAAMEEFVKKIHGISPLSEEGLRVFTEKWQPWNVGKDYFLVRENTVCDYIYFIRKGIARIYYYKHGKEVTEWIAMDGTFFLSITSFFKRVPSKLIIHTIEPAELMGIHHDDLIALCNQSHDIERWFRKLLTNSLIHSQRRMESIQFESAQQRYEKLSTNNPSIIQRVPLSYIASFLGITQETLSRIRSKR